MTKKIFMKKVTKWPDKKWRENKKNDHQINNDHEVKEWPPGQQIKNKKGQEGQEIKKGRKLKDQK